MGQPLIRDILLTRLILFSANVTRIPQNFHSDFPPSRGDGEVQTVITSDPKGIGCLRLTTESTLSISHECDESSFVIDLGSS